MYTRRSVPVDRRREKRLRRADLRQRFHVYAEVRPCRPSPGRAPPAGPTFSPATPCVWLRRLDLENFSKSETTLARATVPADAHPCDRLVAGFPTHPSAEPCDRRFRFGSRARACLDLEKFSKSETASQTTLTRRSVPVDRRRDRIGCRRPYGRSETAVAIASPRAIRSRPRPSRAIDGSDFQV